ncbi:hypothetical protein SKAU_G00021350 [Synaphobranchus kaupii]|uniref:DUF4806 domain-containing protein n=1 Tax=Synaphobranchus kaupii TaxID=118154 RepID=A0A9Q1JEE8_SYNKA|nr:hypothetical protein SKAU_G00021350 [Synaphobranchus kaupii]
MHLSTIGGTTAKDIMGRLMRHILVNELATSFNWLGSADSTQGVGRSTNMKSIESVQMPPARQCTMQKQYVCFHL